MKPYLLAILFITVFLPTPRCCGGGGQKEAGAIDAIALAMRLYGKTHGRPPKTWEELGTVIDLDYANKAIQKVYGYRLQDRYEFIGQKLPMYADAGAGFQIEEGSYVLMARVTPYKANSWGGNPIHVVIYQTKGGDICRGFVEEKKVQALFQNAGFSIPLPLGVPSLESELVNSVPSLESEMASGPAAPRPDYDRAVPVWPPKQDNPAERNSRPVVHDSSFSPNSGVTNATRPVQFRGDRLMWATIVAAPVLLTVGWLLKSKKK